MNRSKMIDKNHPLVGKRIELVHTSDPYTKLKTGDKGTVKFLMPNLDVMTVAVEWESGSNLSLILGVDDFKEVD